MEMYHGGLWLVVFGFSVASEVFGTRRGDWNVRHEVEVTLVGHERDASEGLDVC